MVTIEHEWESQAAYHLHIIIGIVYSPQRAELDFLSFRPICQRLTAVGGSDIVSPIGDITSLV